MVKSSSTLSTMVLRALARLSVNFLLLGGDAQHLGKIRTVLVQGFRVLLVEVRLALEQIADHIVAARRGKGVNVSGDRHAVESFFLGDVGLRVGYGFAKVRKLLGGDVLFFVNLPNLIFALIGDARIF